MYNLIRNLLRYKHLTFSSGFKSVKIFAIFSYTFKVQCGRSRCHGNKSFKKQICKIKIKIILYSAIPGPLKMESLLFFYPHVSWTDSLDLTNILDFKYGLFVQQPLSLSILSIIFSENWINENVLDVLMEVHFFGV